MKLVVVAALIAVSGAAKLERTYLPPSSAATAGGNPEDIQLPFERSGTQNDGPGGIPKGGTVNEFQGVVVDAAAPGTRSSEQETGLGGPRQSYGSQDSKVGEAAFKISNTNPQSSLNLQFSNGRPNSFQHSQFGGQNNPIAIQSPGSQFSGQFGQPVSQPFERIQAARDRTANTVKFESDVGPESYRYSFETDNGIAAEESGVATNGVQAKGGYSYIGDDGQVYSVMYTADEEGYHPVGDHLPTPPPIPEEILRSIEQNARDEAAGLIDDGSYDARKYNEGGDYSESDGDSGQYNRNQPRPGTSNFGQSGFTNRDQSGRITASQGDFSNNNQQAGQSFGLNSNVNKFSSQQGSQVGNVGVKAQQDLQTGFGDRSTGKTTAFSSSFASGQGTGDQNTNRNSQSSLTGQTVSATKNQRYQSSSVDSAEETSVGKDSVGAGTIQEIKTTKETFGSKNQVGYLPPAGQGQVSGATYSSSNFQPNYKQPFFEGTTSEKQTFGQFNVNTQPQGYQGYQYSQQNNILDRKSTPGFSQRTSSQSFSSGQNAQQSSNSQNRLQSFSSYDSTNDNFRFQKPTSQPGANPSTGTGIANSPQSFLQNGASTSSASIGSFPSETSDFGHFTSFSNRNSGNIPLGSNQGQTQNLNRFTTNQFVGNSQRPSLNQAESNVFEQQTSSLNIKSDQPYNYNRPSKPFQTPSEQISNTQKFGDGTKFPVSSSNQFDRLNQQFTSTQQTIVPSSPPFGGSNRLNALKQVTSFDQRKIAQTPGQDSFSTDLPASGYAQQNIQNQRESQISSGIGFQKQTPNNFGSNNLGSQGFGSQEIGSQNRFIGTTQQTNRFSRPENNALQSVNLNQQGSQEQTSTFGEIYQYNKPREQLPMPNKDQSGSATQINTQNSRFTEGASQQSQFTSQSVAGRGESFDTSRRPPSFDSESGYHYR